MNWAELLNHLWQSTALVGLAAAVAWGLRGHQARVRFWVWMAASVKFLLPFGVLAAWAAGWTQNWASVWPHPAAAKLLMAMSQPFPAGASATGGQTFADWATFSGSGGMSASIWPVVLGSVWLAGAAAVLLSWCKGWWRLHRIARLGANNAEALPGAGLRMVTTEQAVEPGVFGIFRPVLLWPAGMPERLSAAQLEAITAHELCHVRRRDNLWSLIHLVTEALFWFHPLVWWIGARMVKERERACDEEVLGRGLDPEVYAGGILQVCRYFVEAPAACAAGVVGGGVKQRVHQIMSHRRGQGLGAGGQWLLGGLALAVVVAPLGAGVLFGQPQVRLDSVSITLSRLPATALVRMDYRIGAQRLEMKNLSLDDIAEAAYGLEPYQLKAPDWMASTRFDLSATATAPVAGAQLAALLQPYLRRRFQWTVRRETQPMQVYALELEPGRTIKAEPATPHGPGTLGMRMWTSVVSINGEDDLRGFAGALSRLVDRPVVDMTGLKGRYDLDVTFAPAPRMGRLLLNGRPPAFAATPAPSAPTAGELHPVPALSTALAEQLGLRLEPRRIAVPVLVVEHAQQQ